MKKTICIILALIMCVALFACGEKKEKADGDLGYILDNGKLVIGITEYEPMNYYDASGKLVGFDTEFAEALCAKLGVKPEFVVINWDTKEFELSSKSIDCIWNGLTVSEERKENMAFTASYLENQQVLVVKADQADNFKTTADFAGLSLAAEEGSAGETSILQDIPDATYVPVGAQTDALLEVKAGTSDGCVLDITLAQAMTGEGTDYADLKMLPISLTNEEYAIGLRLESNAVAKFDEIIKELISDGTIDKLAEKYELTDLLIK